MSTFCRNVLSPVTNASYTQVVDQFNSFSQLASDFAARTNGITQQLQSFNVTPVGGGISYNFKNIEFTPFNLPADPGELVRPNRLTGAAPIAPVLDHSITFNAPPKPTTAIPDEPTITIPTSPELAIIAAPGPPPSLTQISIPDYIEQGMPLVPTLDDLQLPDAPDIDLEQFALTRPDFESPLPYLYDNDYIRNANEARAAIFDTVDESFYAAETEFNLRNTDGSKTRMRLGEMLDGGTGLPAAIEQALFDRAIQREDATSTQAIAQVTQEWAARGFSLPGSTLLARTQEARQANRNARTTLNREITIQVHTQALENLRFVVQQGIALEGQMFDQYIRLHDAGRQMADRAFDVARAIFDARLEVFRTELQIYQADIAAFRERVAIELAKLDVFRSQLEAERVRGEINEQRVRIYEAQLRGVLAGVEVFKAEVSGAEAQIRAQTNQIEQYRSQVEAYRAQLEGEKIKFEIFDTRVKAEESKVRTFESQVKAFTALIDAYRTEVEAESSRVNALGGLNQTRSDVYRNEVQGWRAVADFDVANLNAEVGLLQANVQKYTGLLSAEEARVRGEARNAEIQFEQHRADIAAKVKGVDQAIAQLELASTLGLEALKTAAQVNAQLAASAMAGISVSAQISSAANQSSSRQASCSESYNYSGEN